MVQNIGGPYVLKPLICLFSYLFFSKNVSTRVCFVVQSVPLSLTPRGDDMATSSSITDLATCPVCLDLFDNAKSLPCLHAVCLKCLRGLCRDMLPGDRANCPKCRKEFRIPREWVDGLQDHFIVQRLADNEQLRIRVQESFSDEERDEQQAADRELQLKMQLVKMKDDLTQLQTRFQHQSKEFDDTSSAVHVCGRKSCNNVID